MSKKTTQKAIKWAKKNKIKIWKVAEIETKFEKLIRKQMNDEQFWTWVQSWLDPETIIDIALDWDFVLKLETLKEYKKIK